MGRRGRCHGALAAAWAKKTPSRRVRDVRDFGNDGTSLVDHGRSREDWTIPVTPNSDQVPIASGDPCHLTEKRRTVGEWDGVEVRN